jgi:hypothetical protein
MGAQWYYRVGDQVIGPVGQSELKWLIDQGAIESFTLVRHAEDGGWVAAREIEGLFEPTQHASDVDRADQAGWFYNHQGRTRGPVSYQELRKLVATGKLRSDDLGWEQGTDARLPLGRLLGLSEGRERLVSAEPSQEQVPIPTGTGASRVWKFALAGLAFLIIVGIGIWALVSPRDSGVGRARASMQPLIASKTPVGARPTRSALLGPPLPAQEAGNPTAGRSNAEMVLSGTLGALRAGQPDRARELLDRYIALPEATEKDRARQLRRELLLSTSVSDAAELAKHLNDQDLRAHLRNGAQALAENLRTRELRPFYQNTLMMAFRQENSRRQMVPQDAIAQRPELGREDRHENRPLEPGLPEAGEPPSRKSILEPGRRRPAPEGPAIEGAQGDRGVLARWAEIDQVMESPKRYQGRTISLNGLFKIGTRISAVKDSKDQVVGLSIPVARNDGRTICTGDRRVEAHSLYLILDDSTAQVLRRAFQDLGLKPSSRPTYRAILEVSVRELPLANGSERAIVIESMEILGMCDYPLVARHQYEEAFRVVEVTAKGGHVGLGDGSKWVERLGGEEGFVQPIRRKLRELQRRLVTNSRQLAMDSVYQRELSNAMRISSNYAAIQAMETANWRRRIGP